MEGDEIGWRVGLELVGLDVAGFVSPFFVGLLVMGESVGETVGCNVGILEGQE